jgi:hypothetical protein
MIGAWDPKAKDTLWEYKCYKTNAGSKASPRACAASSIQSGPGPTRAAAAPAASAGTADGEYDDTVPDYGGEDEEECAEHGGYEYSD